MTGKTGVYVCRGCGIGDAVDVGSLAGAAERAGSLAGAAERAGSLAGAVERADGVATVRTSPAFCLEDSALIASDVSGGAVDRVVVAACSPRVKRDVFRFGQAPVTRVNLREHVAWSHEPGAPATQELAADLLQMGIAAAPWSRPANAYLADHERRVLVVGGGVAGMSAALAAAEVGYGVVLVERGGAMGGFAGKLHRGFPWPPAGDAPEAGERRTWEDADPAGLAAQVTAHPGITVLAPAVVTSLEGQPGRFRASVEPADGDDGLRQPQTVEIGSVVMATGWRPVEARAFARYGLGEIADVVTSIDFERMAASGQLLRPSDGRPARRVALLACDGPDDVDNLAYSGAVTDMIALKQAMYVSDLDADASAFVVYEDMDTPGQAESVYRMAQRDPSVFFVRGQVTSVDHQGASGSLMVTVGSSVLARPVVLEADLVVVSVGLRPATLAEGASEPKALNLRYLQGDKMPVWRGGFADSNFLCFPFETRRTGIYAAGGVHRLQNLTEARRDGTAAALKAVQVVEKAAKGQAVHPRVGELGYPEFFLQRCTACGRCTQECPFGALELDQARHPVLDPNRCRRCGICMGACPVQIISFPNYSVGMLSSMAKAVELPEDDEERLRILVLACENDAYPALDMAGTNRLTYPASFRVAPVRCLGSVNAIVVSDAVQRGFDGVALLGCRSGEDYQCHFIQGSELLGRRMDNVRETLDRMALEAERVQVLETSIADAHALPQVLSRFAGEIATLGPNPMKGF
ncbi:MAG: FAD-dependent oxidoreductase [Acidimicrobiales bacterium]